MTLEARTTRQRGATRWRALNDVVLHKGGFARVFTAARLGGRGAHGRASPPTA